VDSAGWLLRSDFSLSRSHAELTLTGRTRSLAGTILGARLFPFRREAAVASIGPLSPSVPQSQFHHLVVVALVISSQKFEQVAQNGRSFQQDGGIVIGLRHNVAM
jgi:hypothetical protein